MKVIIFDSGTLINLSMNGMTYLLKDLKKIFPGKFIITSNVENETIKRPLQIKRFSLGALKINELLIDKTIEMPSAIGIKFEEIKEKAKEILNKVNNSYFARGEYMHIIDYGEASCLALSILSREKGIDNIISIDERTTRMIVENPENLRKLFEKKLHTNVRLENDFSFLKGIRFIRSAELAYIAFKKGFVKLKNGNVLDALLYATKYKGCSISRQEIEEMKRIK